MVYFHTSHWSGKCRPFCIFYGYLTYLRLCGVFWKALEWTLLVYFKTFWYFNGHLVQFKAVCGYLVCIDFPVLVCCDLRLYFIGQDLQGNAALKSRIARWFIFKPKFTIWVNFGGSCNGRCWYILRRSDTFYGHW
jgi:hypothetical protein